VRDVTHAYAADACVENIYTHYQHIHTFRIYRIYTSTHTANMFSHFAYTHFYIYHMTHAYAADAYVSNHEKMRSGIK